VSKSVTFTKTFVSNILQLERNQLGRSCAVFEEEGCLYSQDRDLIHAFAFPTYVFLFTRTECNKCVRLSISKNRRVLRDQTPTKIENMDL
jgi:hypothetical protein